MNAERTFTNVDDKVLVSLISEATQRVMFVAPGLRKVVADALADALRRLPAKVTVVLDVDAEVCRLGYGDEQGLVTIKDAAEKAGTRLHHQQGVRIGLLIADDTTIIYSPVAGKWPAYQRVQELPGIGKILGLTIALETGDVKRFATAGNFASYCRCVKSLRQSNGKKKGENNRKCGNSYHLPNGRVLDKLVFGVGVGHGECLFSSHFGPQIRRRRHVVLALIAGE